MTGLLTALGAVSAFFGVRALMNRMRRSDEQWISDDQKYSYFNRQRMTDTGIQETGSLATHLSEVDSIPAATGVPSTMEMARDRNVPTDMNDTGPNRSQQTFAEADMSANDQAMGPMSTDSLAPDMPEAGVTATGRTELGENYQDQFQGEQNQVAIPTTGMMDAPVTDMPRTQDRSADTGQAGVNQAETNEPVAVGSLVGPLIVHLLSFHNLINLLRTRKETQEAADSNVKQPDVRAGGADAIGSLEGQVPEFDHAALVRGSLQEQIVTLMERIRDALQNMDYSEDQLFHIHDELRPIACKVLDLVHRAQEDNVTGFEDVEKAYHCQ